MFTIGCLGPLIAIFVRDTLHANARTFGLVSGTTGVGLLVGTQSVRRLSQRAASDARRDICDWLRVCRDHGARTNVDSTRDAARHAWRVGSTNASIVFLGQILGLVLSGILAEAIGVRAVFFLCAAIALALVGAGRLFLHAKS